MGKVILTFKNGKTESFRCKNQEKADAIAKKRPNVSSHKFYEENEYIPKAAKKIVVKHELTLEEMERMIKFM